MIPQSAAKADGVPYATQMLRVVSECPTLANPHDRGSGGHGLPGWAPRAPFRPETRFERRGMTAQRTIYDLHVVKR